MDHCRRGSGRLEETEGLEVWCEITTHINVRSYIYKISTTGHPNYGPNKKTTVDMLKYIENGP